MGRSIVIAVKPAELEQIKAGAVKDIIIKNKPEITLPITAYLCCEKTEPNYFNKPEGELKAEFVCDTLICVKHKKCYGSLLVNTGALKTTMSEGQIDYYLSGSDEGWAVRIKKLTMYEPPRNLSAIGISNAPKSWLYIEEKQIKIKKRKTD